MVWRGTRLRGDGGRGERRGRGHKNKAREVKGEQASGLAKEREDDNRDTNCRNGRQGRQTGGLCEVEDKQGAHPQSQIGRRRTECVCV